MIAYNMRSFWAILVVFILISSCHLRIKMSNDPPPPPLAWYNFSVSGFQLKDMIDSLIDKDSSLVYDPFKKATGNAYFGLYMAVGKDTIVYVVHLSGDYRAWIGEPDSSHLALMKIERGALPPDSLTGVILTDTLSRDEQKKHLEHFSSKIIPHLQTIIDNSPRYIIRPLDPKDTLEAQWIFCKGKLNIQCDTLWLTSKDGAEYVLADSSIFIPYKYRN